jgi:tetratricopeptide (TPR) repeat protein
MSEETSQPIRRAPMDGGPVGDAAAPAKLARLGAEIASFKATRAALRQLQDALALANADRFSEAASLAEAALKLDGNIVYGWHLLGIARDKIDDRAGALDAYERAFALSPADPDIAHDLGRLAFRMEMYPQAEALFRHCLSSQPGAREASNNLGALLRRLMRFDEAVDVLRIAIIAEPEAAMLWLTLGTVIGDQGDIEQAEIFYREALRLDPNYAKALYNLSNMLFAQGETAEALDHCRRAITLADTPEDLAMMRFSMATMLLGLGDLEQGWAYYDARLDKAFAEPIHFMTDRPRWTAGADLSGRHLMLFGEQGLGDEILFANALDDALAAVGPEGRVTLAVTDRLLPLFRRSFPGVAFDKHLTLKREGRAFRAAAGVKDWSDVDLWAPMGELLKAYRPSIEAFPERPGGFMAPDAARVAHWREALSDLPGLKVGILWTSLVLNASRYQLFAPFEHWEPVLRTPGISFINLQYGDQSAALAHARDQFGAEVWTPPGIDLKNDLDDVAALCCATDLVLGFSNATFNIAAACGAPAWLVGAKAAWTRLGTDRYPWYSQVRAFAPESHGAWEAVMGDIAQALALEATQGTAARAAG